MSDQHDQTKPIQHPAKCLLHDGFESRVDNRLKRIEKWAVLILILLALIAGDQVREWISPAKAFAATVDE